jgi:excisionase family DNA binding protein
MKPGITLAEQERRARQRAMSIAEFCQKYSTGRTTVYAELKSGRLRGREVGRRTIITEDDAESWLAHLPVIEAAQ